MAQEKPEKLFTYVTLLGEIGFADNNRDGRALLPDTGKPPAEAMQFYRSLAHVEKDGRLVIPELRDAKDPHEFYVGVDAFRAKVHQALGTKNPPPRQYTPGMIAASKTSAEIAKEKFNERKAQAQKSAKDHEQER